MTERSTQMQAVGITMVKQDLSDPETCHSDEGSHVRIVGCAGHRQCRVEHYHGSLVLKEIGREDEHVVFINLDEVFRKLFVSLIKANDGMPVIEALQNGLDRISTYDEVHG